MGIGNGDLRWHMRHDVCVVDNSVSLGNASSYEASESFISHSGLSIGVKLVDVSEQVVEIQRCDSSES